MNDKNRAPGRPLKCYVCPKVCTDCARTGARAIIQNVKITGPTNVSQRAIEQHRQKIVVRWFRHKKAQSLYMQPSAEQLELHQLPRPLETSWPVEQRPAMAPPLMKRRSWQGISQAKEMKLAMVKTSLATKRPQTSENHCAAAWQNLLHEVDMLSKGLWGQDP
jgi:hypothetical protein